MPRHSKNNTAGSVFTYHERQQAGRDWGTHRQRLGADSLRSIDSCCLSLAPCREPLVTSDGWLYEREAILEYIVRQKAENKRKLAAWKQQCVDRAQKSADEEAKRKQHEIDTFEHLQGSMSEKTSTQTSTSSSSSSSSSSSVIERLEAEKPSSTAAGRAAAGANASKKKATFEETEAAMDPKECFWIPQNLPEHRGDVDKPDMKVYCPMSGKVLRLKRLVPVKFVPVARELEDESKAGAKTEHGARYMCPLSRAMLSNTKKCVVLRPSGTVITLDAYNRIVKAEGKDPFCGATLKEGDVIHLKSEGTGYAGAGGKIQAQIVAPALKV